MKTRQWFEGWLLCMGAGLFYLAADANDNGRIEWAWGFLAAGTISLLIVTLMSIQEAHPRKRTITRR